MKLQLFTKLYTDFQSITEWALGLLREKELILLSGSGFTKSKF